MTVTAYVKTYFRIECGYEWGKGIEDDKYSAFKQELEEIFKPLGFDIEPCNISAGSDSAVREKESLYLHPMNFSGYILESSIPTIEKAIQESSLKLRCVDTFETVYDAGAEFLLDKLIAAKDAIREEIFEDHRTTRKSIFSKKTSNTSCVTVKLFNNQLTNKVIREFVTDLKEEMVKQKLLKKSHEYPGYYRSLNKTEMKSWERINGEAFPKEKAPVPPLEEGENLFSFAGAY